MKLIHKIKYHILKMYNNFFKKLLFSKKLSKYHIFISYPNPSRDIVENLRGHLDVLGIKAWVYSLDLTIAANTWDEIENKILECDLIIFVVSNDTPYAKGQHKELNLALKKVKTISDSSKIMPLFIDNVILSNIPQELCNINGAILNTANVQTVALKICHTTFPEIFNNDASTSWKYPIPGRWLEVSKLDEILEQYFIVGDKLYFRTISILGLFECYAPKVKGLFWVSPDNVKLSKDFESDKELEEHIPHIFTIFGIVEIQELGWKAWHNMQPNELKNK